MKSIKNKDSTLTIANRKSDGKNIVKKNLCRYPIKLHPIEHENVSSKNIIHCLLSCQKRIDDNDHLFQVSVERGAELLLTGLEKQLQIKNMNVKLEESSFCALILQSLFAGQLYSPTNNVHVDFCQSSSLILVDVWVDKISSQENSTHSFLPKLFSRTFKMSMGSEEPENSLQKIHLEASFTERNTSDDNNLNASFSFKDESYNIQNLNVLNVNLNEYSCFAVIFIYGQKLVKIEKKLVSLCERRSNEIFIHGSRKLLISCKYVGNEYKKIKGGLILRISGVNSKVIIDFMDNEINNIYGYLPVNPFK